jgi:hypothetical protein
LHQLNGLLGENFVDPTRLGHTFIGSIAGPTINHPVTFQPEEVLNLNQVDGGAAGDFTPDSPMPGIPGLGPVESNTDGIAAEIITYVQLAAGRHTFIVNSDDNFRTYAGHINDLFLGQVAGEFDTPAGRAAADTSFRHPRRRGRRLRLQNHLPRRRWRREYRAQIAQGRQHQGADQ